MENVFSARGVSADPSPLFPTQTSFVPPVTATAATTSNLAIGTGGSSGTSSHACHQAPTRNVDVDDGIGSTAIRPSPLMNGPSPPGFGRSTRTTLPGFGGAGSSSRALASDPSSPPPLPHRRAPRSNFTDLQVAEMVNFSEEIGWTMIYMRYAKGQAEIETFCERIGISKASFKNWLNRFKRVHNIISSTSSKSMANNGVNQTNNPN
ncbi:hypothetical protein ACFE04_020198 [Oxalis oulophora]